MQPIKILFDWLRKNANNKHFLFSFQDLRALFPNLTDAAFKALINRAAKLGYLYRVCRGLYAYQDAIPADGLFLFHVAAYLRRDEFNYISLETVLSDLGVISQVPINRIFIMSSGRSNSISCGEFGAIEFVHTNQKPEEVMDNLVYDQDCGMWRANLKLALRDMKMTKRSCDLIDWDVANELV